LRLALLIACTMPLVSAAECVTRSGPTTAALVELYTSEGCSSCPPADRWLSGLKALAGKATVVPLGFHVTYWDYIGWRDAFADERNTARQRARASASGARYVYTPQVMVGGRDFRGWRGGADFERAVEKINRMPARADLELRLVPVAGGKLVVEATAQAGPGVARDHLALVVAAVQDGLGSRVTAGENRGEQLRHDFVVREFAEMRAFPGSGPATAKATFSLRDEGTTAPAAAAFVQDLRTGEVLQALAAPPCR
jgi:hypothetical protein